MSEPDDIEAALARRTARLDQVARALWYGPRSEAYRWLVVAWAVAVAARVTLLAGQPPSWWIPMALVVLGTVQLLRWGGRVGWLLCAVGLLWPLVFLRDWLTQSLWMALVACVGAATVSAPPCPGAAVRAAARHLGATAYAIAAFHKLNRGFFDLEISCATYGDEKWRALLDPWPWPELGAWAPMLVVGVEVAIFGLLYARPRAGIALAALFHVPLTAVLAPAFAFVMAVGWSAALGPADRAALRRTFREAGRPLVAVAAVAGFAIAAFQAPETGLAAAGVLGVKLTALVAVALLAVGSFRRAPAPAAADPPPWGPTRIAVTGAVVLWLATAATPYLGTQTQHTGAMLSNLRVDRPCWNHLVVPRPVIADDPYVRIDDASIGRDPGRFARNEDILRDTLWSSTALRLMQRHWCDERTRPIRVAGTFRGAPFALADLCASEAELPSGPGVLGGPEWFPHWLRLQKNLPRECAAACVH